MLEWSSVTKPRGNPIAGKEVAVVLDSVFERVMENPRSAIAVVGNSPLQTTAGVKVVCIGGFDEITNVADPGTTVIENGRSPGDGLNPLRSAEQCCHLPVVPDKVSEQVITFFTVHIDGTSVVGCR